MAAKKAFLYISLARQLEGQIQDGSYDSGQKLPSIKQLTRKLGLSVNTVFRAYVELEQMGLIEARPKSGYYVKARSPRQDHGCRKTPVYDARRDLPAFSDDIRAAIKNPAVIPFGQAMISPGLFPGKALTRIVKSISAREMEQLMAYGPVKGNRTLRQQLAGRMLGLADRVSPDNILITNGCMEAIALSLMAVTTPGDTIAVEAPTYFGYMQILRELKLSIAEIPSDPATGMDLNAFEKAVTEQDIKACLLVPNFQNPVGSVMPDDHKAFLIRLAHEKGITVIEDDVYSELYHGRSRPGLLKSFDSRGQVITCSSFSKTLSPGLRIGWVTAQGPVLDRIRQIKFSISMMTTSLDQFVLAAFISGNGYDRHLRSLRLQLKKQVAAGAKAVQRYFPQGTDRRIPRGGFVLWVRLPGKIDSLALYRQAMDQGIAILPGTLCSLSGKFRNYIRISCGFPHGPEIEDGFRRLGNIAGSLAGAYPIPQKTGRQVLSP